MRRDFLLLAVLTLGAAVSGCKTPEALSGWVPGIGAASATERELPSPRATMQAEMPEVEGSWDAP